jgi:hypothetical protein
MSDEWWLMIDNWIVFSKLNSIKKWNVESFIKIKLNFRMKTLIYIVNSIINI